MKRLAVALFALALLNPALCRAQRGGNSWENQGNVPVSPEIHPDGTVTFRLFAPDAKEVLLVGAPVIAVMGGQPGTMVKDDRGLWSITIGPVPPGYYNYGFAEDGGIRSPDPANPNVELRQWGHTSYFIVHDQQPQIFEPRKVPHGTVAIVTYDSKTLNLTRRAFVYTPPGYEESPGQRYPVLYLLHGSGLFEGAWVETGQANFILDNLLAAGKIRPMVVVMPYGAITGSDQPQGIENGPAPAAEGRGGRGVGNGFQNDLLNDLKPLIEAKFHVLTDRAHRAIAGLSAGADQASSIGLGHLDLFSAIGAFSGNGLRNASLDAANVNAQLQTFMLVCGKNDPAFRSNQQEDQTLTDQNIRHVFLPTEGAHIWPVWQYALTQFAPAIFPDPLKAADKTATTGAAAQN